MRATGKDHDRAEAEVCQVPPVKSFYEESHGTLEDIFK
jgi:hypothetical protein